MSGVSPYNLDHGFPKVPPSPNLPRGRLEEAIEEEVCQRVRGRGRRIHVLRNPHLLVLLHGAMSAKVDHFVIAENIKSISLHQQALINAHGAVPYSFPKRLHFKKQPVRVLAFEPRITQRLWSTELHQRSKMLAEQFQHGTAVQIPSGWANLEPHPSETGIFGDASLTPKGLIVPSDVEPHDDLCSFHTLKFEGHIV